MDVARLKNRLMKDAGHVFSWPELDATMVDRVTLDALFEITAAARDVVERISEDGFEIERHAHESELGGVEAVARLRAALAG